MSEITPTAAPTSEPIAAPTYDDSAERRQLDWLAQIQQKREALAQQRQKDDAAYRRRSDNARKWAAWMDALSAAGNLLWTSRNSGNLRDPNASVDKALQARLAEKTAWRDKQRTAMDAAMERATAAQGQIFSARTAAAQRRYQRALANANLAAKNEANRITSQYNADRLRQNQANADRNYELKKQGQESLNAYRNGNLALRAQSNRISASKGNGSGSSGRKVVGTVEGQPYYNNNDYSTALYGAARKYGIPTQTQTKNWDGSTKNTNRNWKDVAADVKAAYNKSINNGGNSGNGGNSNRYSGFSIHKRK